MLKLLPLSAVIAAVFSTQVPGSVLASPTNAANQGGQASLSELVTSKTLSTATDSPNADLVYVQSSPNPPREAERGSGAGVLLGTVAVAGGAVAAILSTRKANNLFKPGGDSPKNTIRLDQASRALQKKLLRLVHNDRDTATRLLAQVRLRNPDRPVNWYVEKVIYDLERDRH